MNGAFNAARRARLRVLLWRHLSNGRDVWRAYCDGAQVPPLRFRNGLTLSHGDGDAPVFLFFEVFANGCYRRRFDPPQDGVIVDIGANIGAFTLDCAARFLSVTIEAYEPNPHTYTLLRQNIEANGLEERVRTYPEAVGREAGVLKLWTGHGTIAATAYPDPAEARGLFAECRVVDLATVFARTSRRIDLVKIDAEGAEADILEGGRAALSQAAQYVGEYHEDRDPGVLGRCRSVLEAGGFTMTSGCTHRCGPMFAARRDPSRGAS